MSTLAITSLTDNEESNDMEIERVANTLVVPETDAPFSPPSGTWDVGDIVRHGKNKWMILGSDQKWHEDKGPDEWALAWKPVDKFDFLRRNDHWSGYGDDLAAYESCSGYTRWDESELDAEWNKYKLSSKDEKKLKELVESMKKGKVKPTNVACFALGSLYINYEFPKRSFEQLAVLLKLIELLEIPPSARKVMQDPIFTPRDARFFAKFGLETVLDPEGFDSINEGTLVFHVGGYEFLDMRAMERAWPAVYVNIGGPFCNREHIVGKSIAERVANLLMGNFTASLEGIFNKRKVKIWWENRKKAALIGRAYSWNDFPRVGICDGMRHTHFYWRKEVAGTEVE